MLGLSVITVIQNGTIRDVQIKNTEKKKNKSYHGSCLFGALVSGMAVFISAHLVII